MFEITHPFHPLRGQRFELAARRLNWGEDRVMYFTEQGKLSSMPTSWTNVASEDVFLQTSDGRSWFRLDDLVDLTTLLEAVRSSR